MIRVRILQALFYRMYNGSHKEKMGCVFSNGCCILATYSKIMFLYTVLNPGFFKGCSTFNAF